MRQSAASAAAAIAPATESPAGVKTLVMSMDDRLAAMQRQIESTKAQNQLLAIRMRQIAMVYRQAAQGSPASMFGGMGGGGMPSMGGAGGFPGMGMFAKQPGILTSQNSRQAADQLTSDLFGRDGNGSDRATERSPSQNPSWRTVRGGCQWTERVRLLWFDSMAYRQAGVRIPRTTYDLVHVGTPVSRGHIRAGDLILCNWQNGRPEHVVMAVSPDMVNEAPNRHERSSSRRSPPGTW